MHVQEPNHPDELKYSNEVFAALYEVYQNQIAGTPQETPAAAFYWENYFKPLWQLQLDHPDGLYKGPQLGDVAAFPAATASQDSS